MSHDAVPWFGLEAPQWYLGPDLLFANRGYPASLPGPTLRIGNLELPQPAGVIGTAQTQPGSTLEQPPSRC